MQKRQRKERGKTGGHVGIIKNVDFAFKGIVHAQVTTFEIHESDGDVYYGAVGGHAFEFKEGSKIEYWPTRSARSIVKDDIPRIRVSGDGTITRWTETVYWYPLERYRILPEDTPENDMSPAGGPA